MQYFNHRISEFPIRLFTISLWKVCSCCVKDQDVKDAPLYYKRFEIEIKIDNKMLFLLDLKPFVFFFFFFKFKVIYLRYSILRVKNLQIIDERKFQILLHKKPKASRNRLKIKSHILSRQIYANRGSKSVCIRSIGEDQKPNTWRTRSYTNYSFTTG